MPITENSFTGEELTQAVQANPGLVDILKGAVINTEAIRSAIEPDIIGSKKKEWAERDEQETFALTGIAKKEKEAYYDYRKRAFEEKTKSMSDELTALKDKANPSAADKLRIEQLEKTLTDKDGEYNAKIESFKKEVSEVRTMSALEAAWGVLKTRLKPGMPEELVNTFVQNAMNKLTASAQVQEDKTVTFIDSEGKVRLSKSDYKPLAALAVLEEEIKSILDEGKKAAGAGSGNEGEENKEDKKWTGLPKEVTTQVQLTEHLAKLGILQGSEEYDKIWAEHAGNLKLR